VANERTRILRSLRVVRRYADREIPDDVLRDVLEVARWTGTSKNTQAWHVVVVRDEETRKRLAKLGRFATHLAGANVVIALVMDGPGNAFDCGRLAERLMLAAWSHGVGSCIGSIWPDDNERAAKELLGVPKDRWMHQTIAFGYPKDPRGPQVRAGIGVVTLVSPGRRALAELVSWERYGSKV
jgi:nitroreductase